MAGGGAVRLHLEAKLKVSLPDLLEDPHPNVVLHGEAIAEPFQVLQRSFWFFKEPFISNFYPEFGVKSIPESIQLFRIWFN